MKNFSKEDIALIESALEYSINMIEISLNSAGTAKKHKGFKETRICKREQLVALRNKLRLDTESGTATPLP